MVKKKSACSKTLRLCLIAVIFYSSAAITSLYGQDTSDSTFELGTISFPKKASSLLDYDYDSEKDLYVYKKNNGEYPIDVPLVLTPKEY